MAGHPVGYQSSDTASWVGALEDIGDDCTCRDSVPKFPFSPGEEPVDESVFNTSDFVFFSENVHSHEWAYVIGFLKGGIREGDLESKWSVKPFDEVVEWFRVVLGKSHGIYGAFLELGGEECLEDGRSFEE